MHQHDGSPKDTEPLFGEAHSNALWQWIHTECPPRVERVMAGVSASNAAGWAILVFVLARLASYGWIMPYVLAAMGVAATVWFAIRLRRWMRQKSRAVEGIEVEPDPRTPDGMARAMWLAGLPAREIAVCEYLLLRDKNGPTDLRWAFGLATFFMCLAVWALAGAEAWAALVLGTSWLAAILAIGGSSRNFSFESFVHTAYAPRIESRLRAVVPESEWVHLPGTVPTGGRSMRVPNAKEALVAAAIIACIVIPPLRAFIFSKVPVVFLASGALVAGGLAIRRGGPLATQRAHAELHDSLRRGTIVVEWEQQARTGLDADAARVLAWRFSAMRDPKAPCPERDPSAGFTTPAIAAYPRAFPPRTPAS